MSVKLLVIKSLKFIGPEDSKFSAIIVLLGSTTLIPIPSSEVSLAVVIDPANPSKVYTAPTLASNDNSAFKAGVGRPIGLIASA